MKLLNTDLKKHTSNEYDKNKEFIRSSVKTSLLHSLL